MLTAADYFDLECTALAGIFADTAYVWEAVARIGPWIEAQFAAGLQPGHTGAQLAPSAVLGDAPIYIGPGTVVGPGVYIEGPAIIGANCEIRHTALLRANTILGDGAIVGHASETKNALLLEHAAAPHFAYVGDSILGQRVNLGAGSKLSNVGITSRAGPDAPRRHVMLHCDGVTHDSGLTKLGAILGTTWNWAATASPTPACSSARAAWSTRSRRCCPAATPPTASSSCARRRRSSRAAARAGAERTQPGRL